MIGGHFISARALGAIRIHSMYPGPWFVYTVNTHRVATTRLLKSHLDTGSAAYCQSGEPFLDFPQRTISIDTELKNLRKHLLDNGPVPRQHGLVGRTPQNTYRYEVTYDAVHFIRNYAELFGIPQPAAR